jgi:phage-related minor tail protein
MEQDTAMPEVSLFSEDDKDDIFADSVTEEDFLDSPSENSSGGTSVDDVFQDALSAVGYSEREEESGADDLMALDEFALDETAGMEDTAEGTEEPEESVEKVKVRKAKKPKEPKDPQNSFWKRTFGNVITENTAAEEAKERELEMASEEERKAAKEEKKKQQAEEKAAKAEAAKAEKEKKAAAKAQQAAEKAAAKEEKKRKKAELEAAEVVGKINPVGATIVMVFFCLLCTVVIVGTQSFSYSRAIKTAESSFEKKDYQSAYDSIAGVKVSDSFKETEEKIRLCMKLQKQLNSYDNYYKMHLYLEALDSLVKGIRSYDTDRGKAEQYEMLTQYNELESQIAANLYSEFGVSETEARSIISSGSQEEYTAQLEQIISRWEAQNSEDEK